MLSHSVRFINWLPISVKKIIIKKKEVKKLRLVVVLYKEIKKEQPRADFTKMTQTEQRQEKEAQTLLTRETGFKSF